MYLAVPGKIILYYAVLDIILQRIVNKPNLTWHDLSYSLIILPYPNPAGAASQSSSTLLNKELHLLNLMQDVLF